MKEIFGEEISFTSERGENSKMTENRGACGETLLNKCERFESDWWTLSFHVYEVIKCRMFRRNSGDHDLF